MKNFGPKSNTLFFIPLDEKFGLRASRLRVLEFCNFSINFRGSEVTLIPNYRGADLLIA